MSKKNVALLAIVASVLLLLSGCDALFQNTFKQMNLGQPTAAQLAAQLAQLESQAQSADPVVAQTAQAAIIDQKLEQSDAGKIVNSIDISKLTEIKDDPGKIVDAVIPADLQSDTTKLAAAINDLKDLKTDVDNLAAKIKDNGGEAVIDNAGEELQTALIVTVVSNLTPVVGYDTIGAAVAAYVEAANSAPEGTEVDPTTYFTPPDEATIKSNTTLTTLLGANGYASFDDFVNSFSGKK